MVQRIQTIYLALAAVFIGLALALPFATYSFSDVEIIFNAYGVSKNESEIATFFPYYIILALSMGLCLFSILQYKKRKNQITVGRLNYVLIGVVIFFIFFDFYSIAGQIRAEDLVVSYGAGMFMPVVALPLLFMANRNIRKDEALIKSLDRLR